MQGSKTPIVDLLRKIPRETWVEIVESSGWSYHTNIGELIHQAADEIVRLQIALRSDKGNIMKKVFILEVNDEETNTTTLHHIFDMTYLRGNVVIREQKDFALCPRCKGNLNKDGYCFTCGYPFPFRY